MTPELLTAYENADYVVFGPPQFVLRIGEPSRRLDMLLEAGEATTAAFITAANPRGERRSAAENQPAVLALNDLLVASGYPLYPGEGRDPERGSPPEPSVLVIGIYRDNAEALGRLFGQNAIVFVEKGKAPQLIILN